MSTSQTTHVFLTGATGYLGGATLQLLMQNSDLAFTALVRSEEKAIKLEQFGVKTLIGTLDDAALLESEGAKADAILQSAAYDHLEGVDALLRGAKAHFQQTHKESIFIQTSVPGGFATLDAMGQYTSEHRISDLDPNLPNLTNATLPHSAIHEALISADDEGYVRSYIVYPTVVYGVLKGPLVNTGIVHPYSIAMSLSVELSIKRGQGSLVGSGTNRWSGVHIDDMAELYRLVFERALAGDAPHGLQGHYMSENGEFRFADAARRFTAVLHAHGKSATADPEAFTTAEIESNPLISFLGIDVRIKGDRARQLGWSPTHDITEFFESVQEETEASLAGKN